MASLSLKDSRKASTRQTSPGEVKNSTYLSECFDSSWDFVTYDPLRFKD